MTERLFTTQEVGSLAKPNWRVKGISGERITESDLSDAFEWGRRLSIDPEPLIEILRMATLLDQGKLPADTRKKIRQWASLYAVRLQELAGLDVIYDGEQNRSEMYQHAVSRSQGFERRGKVRSFDKRYYDKYACVDRPSLVNPWHVEEFLELQELTEKEIKVPITGAYTIAAWSFDEYYGKQARRDFVLDVARGLIRPNIEVLLAKGARRIQIDEPAATTIPSEVPLFVEAFNESVRDLKGEFSVHICFSGYGSLFPDIQHIENCSEYSLELANRDSHRLGTQDVDRPGYAVLKLFRKYNISGRIGLGVVDVHSDFIEPVELVRDRIIYAVKVLGDPRRVHPSPDCGLRTRSWPVAFAKLKSVVEGARLAQDLLA